MELPKSNEYAPGYQKYIDLAGTGDYIEMLDQNTASTVSFFQSIDQKKENYKYAEDKWTIKEVFMHIIDTERGFSYRAIVSARGDDQTPLYGMDENHYANNVDVSGISMADLIEEFVAVRKAFRFIYTTTELEKLSFLANAIGHKISARAIGYISIGHALHHCSVIEQKYLS